MSQDILTPEEIKARKQAYRDSPKGKATIAAYNKKYAEDNAERLRAYRIDRYITTKDGRREHKAAIDKKYRDGHKEEINARRRAVLQSDEGQRTRAKQRSKAWYLANKDEALAKCRTTYIENKDYIKQRVAAYQKANPEATRLLHRVKAHRRRERLALAGGEFTRHDIENLMRWQRGKCANCHISLSDGYHIDHINPVAKGGGNDPNNLELLCPACNQKKSDKLPHVFAGENGRLL